MKSLLSKDQYKVYKKRQDEKEKKMRAKLKEKLLKWEPRVRYTEKATSRRPSLSAMEKAS